MNCHKSVRKMAFASTLIALIVAASIPLLTALPTFAQGSKPGEVSDIVIQTQIQYIYENGTLVTLPFPVNPGDVVLLDDGGNVNDPSTWSDVLRFSDDPMGANPFPGGSVTHCQLFSKRSEGASDFVDRFTGFKITPADLRNYGAYTENPSGVTTYAFYYIYSLEEPSVVGGTLVSANRLNLLIPSMGLIFAAAVIIKLGLRKKEK